MPNVMVALLNVGGALYSTPQTLADAHCYMPCSNAAKTRKQFKFGRMLQTNKTISAASGPKFTILWGHVEKYCCLTSFFRLSIRALVAKIYPDKVVRWCPDGDFWRLLCPAFATSRVQHLSDLHSKFALRPHHVSKYGRHATCGR